MCLNHSVCVRATAEYTKQVNEAGKDVWVVLHLYQEPLQVSKLLNQHLAILAKKFPATKFVNIKSQVGSHLAWSLGFD